MHGMVQRLKMKKAGLNFIFLLAHSAWLAGSILFNVTYSNEFFFSFFGCSLSLNNDFVMDQVLARYTVVAG